MEQKISGSKGAQYFNIRHYRTLTFNLLVLIWKKIHVKCYDIFLNKKRNRVSTEPNTVPGIRLHKISISLWNK